MRGERHGASVRSRSLPRVSTTTRQETRQSYQEGKWVNNFVVNTSLYAIRYSLHTYEHMHTICRILHFTMLNPNHRQYRGCINPGNVHVEDH